MTSRGPLSTRKAIHALCCLALMGACMPVVHAETVALTTGDEYPPFTGIKLAEGGMLTEVVRKAFLEVGMKTTLDWLPWKRGYLLVKTGKYAATFPYLRSPQREEDMLYSEPMYTVARYIWATPGFKGHTDDLESFGGMHYCIPLGYVPLPIFEPLIKAGKLTLETPQDMASCVRMLLYGRADFFSSNLLNGNDAIKGFEGKIVASKEPVERAAFYLIAGRAQPGSQKLVDDFNRGLASLKQRGELERILKKHGG